MAVLSRWPVALVADHSAMLWRDVPDTLFIDAKGRTGPDATGYDVQRLSSSVHWELRVTPPGSDTLTLMVFHATPPVFDGSEDRNGRRNADEVLFWRHRLDGAFGPPPEVPFAILGTFNLAPDRGQGLRPQLVEFLADPRLRDLPDLIGKPTAHWPDPGPGSLRVDYILPSADLAVRDATLMATDPQISRHQPIVVTLDLPQAADN